MRDHGSQTRDAALRRLGRANRWLIAGSVTLTGVLAEVAAQAFPGKSVHSPATGAAASSSAHTPAKSAGSGSAKAPGGELRPPAQAPQQAPERESPQPQPAPESSSPEPSGQAGSGQESPGTQQSTPPVVSGGS
jgi:hypothetical protein